MTEKASEKTPLLPEYHPDPPQYNQVGFQPEPYDGNNQGPHQDQIQAIPLPPLQGAPERERNKKMIISIVLFTISLFLAHLVAVFCLLPSFYWLYQAKNEQDPERKKKLVNKVICSSGIVMGISIAWFIFEIGMTILVLFLEHVIFQTEHQTTNYDYDL